MKNNKLVSFCIFTYNQEKYIKNSIESVLSQAYTPMEIIISDDCSTDSTFKIVEETVHEYSGEHKIITNRNEINLGIGGHVSKVCRTIANGDYIIFLGGDDISKSEHVSILVQQLENFPEVKMIDINADIIDETGNLVRLNTLDYDYKKFDLDDYIKLHRLDSFAPGRIIKRELVDTFELISNNCPTEDSVFVFRSLLNGGFIRINNPLVQYRVHSSNISSQVSLAKLDNFAIVSQYMMDLIKYYNDGKIGEKVSTQILNRLVLEHKLREFKHSIPHNKFRWLIKAIKIKFLKLSYKLKELIA